MRTSRRRRTRTLALAAAAVAVCGLAPAALAGFVSSLGAGSMAITAASLAAPTGVTGATNAATCVNNKASSLTVNLGWTASSSAFATGYTIYRDAAGNGVYSVVGTVAGVGATSWSDTTGALAFSTTYHYEVETDFRSWTAVSAPVAVTTLGKLCR